MRELHFRARDIKKNKWIWPYPEPFHIIGEVTVFDMIKQYSFMAWNDIEITQGTGLNDKTGKEIYEGDIIKWRTKGTETCNAVLEYIETDGNIYTTPYINSTSEVIGNIYENKDLFDN